MAKKQYTWNPLTDSVIEETDGEGNVLVEYVNEPSPYGPLLSQHKPGEDRYFHFDALGSTRSLTGESGDVTDTFTYDAWGNQVINSTNMPTTFLWQGKLGYQNSCATNKLAIRRREYLPITSRWFSTDPAPYPSEQSLYLYTKNNPALLSDPSGLEWVNIQGSIWKATADGDSLETLAMIVSNNARDWVCIWPQSRAKWENYPTAKACATADVKNLLDQGPRNRYLYQEVAHGPDIDFGKFERAIERFFGREGGTTFISGRDAAMQIATFAKFGSRPISRLIVAGHSIATGVIGGDTASGNWDMWGFKPSQLLEVSRIPSNSINYLEHALGEEGPPRCWFTRNAMIYGFACNSSPLWTESFASEAARPNSIVYGFDSIVYAAWDGFDGSKAVTTLNAFDPNLNADSWANNIEQLLRQQWIPTPGLA